MARTPGSGEEALADAARPVAGVRAIIASMTVPDSRAPRQMESDRRQARAEIFSPDPAATSFRPGKGFPRAVLQTHDSASGNERLTWRCWQVLNTGVAVLDRRPRCRFVRC